MFFVMLLPCCRGLIHSTCRCRTAHPTAAAMPTHRRAAAPPRRHSYTTLFVTAFPLAPLLAAINNYLEIRVDGYKVGGCIRVDG